MIEKKLEEWLQKRIGRINDSFLSAWSSSIKSGRVAPPLKASTIRAKERKGYTSPEAPLYATGAFAEGVETVIEGLHIKFYGTSPVNPWWHLRGSRLPQRKPLTNQEISQAIAGALR
ncbi:MAG TPA: hypothetical protein PLX04_08115 [Caldisericia bacterium]|nr:hypothetical protein [Caldisericia bacterium]